MLISKTINITNIRMDTINITEEVDLLELEVVVLVVTVAMALLPMEIVDFMMIVITTIIIATAIRITAADTVAITPIPINIHHPPRLPPIIIINLVRIHHEPVAVVEEVDPNTETIMQ